MKGRLFPSTSSSTRRFDRPLHRLPYGGPCINVIHPAYPSRFHPQRLLQCRSSPHTLQIESPQSTQISRYSLLLRFVRRPLFSLLSPHYLEFTGVTYTQTSPLSQPHV